MPRAFARTFLLILLLLSLSVTPSRAAQPSEDETEEFLQSIGKTVYAFAWPTATYEGTRLDDIRANPQGGTDVVFVVHGTSAFSGGSLWTEVIITLKNWEITNLRWGRNNAILAQPGETVAAFGQMLKELNREAGSTPSAPAQPTLTQTWTLVDQCNDGAGIRFRFFDMTGGQQRLLWPNADEVYLLSGGGSRTLRLNVSRGAKICYGAAPDVSGTGSYWGIGTNGDESCEDCCRSADVPDVTFTLSCT